MAGGDTRRSVGTLTRLALFVAGLAVIAGVAALLGRASDLSVEAEGDGPAMAHESAGGSEPVAAHGASDVGGGYSLTIAPTTLAANASVRVELTIRDARGVAVTALDETRDEPPLHLIVVRRDLSGYQHLHPKRSGESFSVEVTLPEAGVWRAYADFEVDGEKIVLGRDLIVPGSFSPRPPADPSNAAQSADYAVRMSAKEARAGEDATLSFAISRAGTPVSPQPFLGAGGHLVAIREDDLAYLHVHPLENRTRGTVAFDAEFAEAGRYALFLQFKHAGVVQTVRFTIEVAR